MNNVKNPRLTRALLVLVLLMGIANLGLFAVTGAPMQVVIGLVFVAAATVNLARLKAAAS